ncbi:MAG: 4Fe-4S cluster-binding domain-containing protein [Candidatus Aminicenantes bacterium]|nr:4Fe-4S cluster-binding domain-containing protein [Candidatus Aminicenantes bacterium]
MEFSGFTFIVTEDCNFNCSYCHQIKGKKSIDPSTVEKTLDFFLPFLTEECYINFYGGEPLLAFDRIKHAVSTIQEKNKRLKKHVQYSMTTNGSLINHKILQFLNQNKFLILLSFDGLAQDVSKKSGSFDHIVSIIKEILKYSDIDLETNSVFTPSTVRYLSQSIQFIIELGVPNLDLSLDKFIPWDSSSLSQLENELSVLREFLHSSYENAESIPLVDFRQKPKKDIFCCFAGKDRMAITPDGELWGCCLFPDFFKGKKETADYKKYCFGDLDSFVDNHETVYPEILSNFSTLRTDHFFTPEISCILCNDLEECGVCPLDTVFSGSITKRVPLWMCEIKKIFRKEKRLLWKELEEPTKK